MVEKKISRAEINGMQPTFEKSDLNLAGGHSALLKLSNDISHAVHIILLMYLTSV